MFSERIGRMEESLTLAMSQKARELKTQGRDVIAFSAGEPDLDAPAVVKNAAIEAINSGYNKYTAVSGSDELLSAIAGKLKRDNALEYSVKQIVSCTGAKHALFQLFAVLINHNDEVIVPTPAWVSYPEMVRYHGGKAILVPTKPENGFKITPAELKKALTPKTKILVLNSPSNPTGSVYSREEILALGETLKGSSVLVFSDEIYEKLVYTSAFCSAASVSDDMFSRTITINGLSKSAAMTGWRIGYFAAARVEIANAVTKLQSQSTTNLTSIVQKAAIPALDGRADDDIERMRAIFERRRNLALELFSGIEKLRAIVPMGSFYIFVSCEAYERNSMKFCLDMLDKVGVSTVPGVGFACEGYFRFSFATDEDSIKRGVGKIAEFVKGFK